MYLKKKKKKPHNNICIMLFSLKHNNININIINNNRNKFLMRLLVSTTNSLYSHFNLFSSVFTFFSSTSTSNNTWHHLQHHNLKHIKMEPTTVAIAAATVNTKPISSTTNRPRRKRKVVVILGPTGAGKSRLSIDLATRFYGEIINSDKIQVYSGLDITTNKITLQEQMGIPHHLLGSIDPTQSVFTPSDFRKQALEIISDIKARRRLPFIVGGSNSLIHALVSKKFDPKIDIFTQPDPDPELRYDCCFIWMDVCLPVLNSYLSKRVDEMLDSGMFEELEEFFRSGHYKKVNRTGLGQAIGIPEFAEYFEKYPSGPRIDKMDSGSGSDRMLLYNEAARKIKDNTCQLAKKQVRKILRLRDIGYDLKRIDATEAFRTAMMTSECGGGGGGTRVAEIWEKHVLEPSMKIVMQFLDE